MFTAVVGQAEGIDTRKVTRAVSAITLYSLYSDEIRCLISVIFPLSHINGSFRPTIETTRTDIEGLAHLHHQK